MGLRLITILLPQSQPSVLVNFVSCCNRISDKKQEGKWVYFCPQSKSTVCQGGEDMAGGA